MFYIVPFKYALFKTKLKVKSLYLINFFIFMWGSTHNLGITSSDKIETPDYNLDSENEIKPCDAKES